MSRRIYSTEKLYALEPPPKGAKRERALYAILSVCPFALYAATGLLDADMGRLLHTALPFAIMLLPLLFIPASALPVVMGETQFSERRKGKIFQRGSFCGWLSALLSLWCAVCTLVFCLGNPERAAAQIPFGAGCLAVFGALIVFLRFHKSLSKRVYKMKNTK